MHVPWGFFTNRFYFVSNHVIYSLSACNLINKIYAGSLSDPVSQPMAKKLGHKIYPYLYWDL